MRTVKMGIAAALVATVATARSVAAQETRDTLAALHGSTQTFGLERLTVDGAGATLLTFRVTDVQNRRAGSDLTLAILARSPAGFITEAGPVFSLTNHQMAVLLRFGIGALIGDGGFVPAGYFGIGFVARLSDTIGLRLDAGQRLFNSDRDWVNTGAVGFGATFLPR